MTRWPPKFTNTYRTPFGTLYPHISKSHKSKDVFRMHISSNAFRCISNDGFTTLGQLLYVSEQALMCIKGCDSSFCAEIHQELQKIDEKDQSDHLMADDVTYYARELQLDKRFADRFRFISLEDRKCNLHDLHIPALAMNHLLPLGLSSIDSILSKTPYELLTIRKSSVCRLSVVEMVLTQLNIKGMNTIQFKHIPNLSSVQVDDLEKIEDLLVDMIDDELPIDS